MTRITSCVAFGLAFVALACAPAPPPPETPDLTADPPQGSVEGAAKGGASTEVARGVAYVKNEKYAEAKPHFEEALKADPKHAEASYYLGLCKEKLGDRPGAEELYKKAIEIDPKFVEASENLAAMFLDDPPRPDEAIKLLKEALAKAPGNARLMQNLAYAHGLKGDIDAASKQYEAAIAKGDSVQLRFAYGALLFEAKQHDKAAEQLRKALDAAGDDPPMLATLGRMLAHSKAFGDCVKAFDRAIKLKPTDPEFFVRRGTCKHELKDEDGAKADYDAAVKVDPQFAAAHYYQGLSFLAAKQRAAAQSALEKAAKLGGDTAIGKQAKEKLESLKGGGGKKK
jgi:Flp pilus assembly protein TadD